MLKAGVLTVRSCEACRYHVRPIWIVWSKSIVVWDECSGQSQEVRPVAEEDDHGEEVAENPFHEASDEKKYTSEPDTRCGRGDRTSTGTSPSHECDRDGYETDREAQESNRCRIRKALSQIASDGCLRLEVELLE